MRRDCSTILASTRSTGRPCTNPSVERQAIDHTSKITQGYPYFVQQWAYNVWNCARGKSIDLRAAQNADSASRKNLDEGFFSVRFDRLTKAKRTIYGPVHAPQDPGLDAKELDPDLAMEVIDQSRR
jgi:hypothetical protein